MADDIEIEILEDGQVKFTTSKISGANHASADQLLAELEEILGGHVERKKVKGHKQHVHKHIHH